MQTSLLVSCSKEELLFEIEKIVANQISKLNSNFNYTPNKNDFISQKEVADFLKISEATLIKFKKEGKLTYKRIGKRYYYTKKDLVNCMYKIEKRI